MADNKNKKITTFDKKEYYETELAPILKELEDKCFLNQIPCFFTFAVKSTPEETEYVSGGIMTGSGNFHLAEDRIKSHMMITAGWVAKPRYEAEAEMIEEDFFADDDF